VRGCSDGYRAGGLPENVLGLGATGQGHILGRGLLERSGNLEDPYVVGTTGKGEVIGYGYVGGPLVEARSQGEPANLSSAQVDGIRQRSSGCVVVGSLHVADSSRQTRWVRHTAGKWTSGIHGVDDPIHLATGKTDSCTGDGTGPNISVNSCLEDVRNT